VEGQNKEEEKPIEVEGVEEWKIEKILNKKKIQGVDRYLVHWKRFIAENNTWEKEEDLGHARELVDKFKERLSAEVRWRDRTKNKTEFKGRRI